MRKVVYVLLLTEFGDDGIKIAVGPVCWERIDANQTMHRLADQGFSVQVIEKEVRGEMPQMRAAPAHPERGE